jgi:nucleobase transporter 1/2
MFLLQLQGAIITASLFQVVIGATGLMGYIMKYLGPLTITPTIALIGIALFDVAANTCATQWGIAIL